MEPRSKISDIFGRLRRGLRGLRERFELRAQSVVMAVGVNSSAVIMNGP